MVAEPSVKPRFFLPAVFDEFFTSFFLAFPLCAILFLLLPNLGFFLILSKRMLWILPYHRALTIARSGSGTASIPRSLLRRWCYHLRHLWRRHSSRCCLWHQSCHHCCCQNPTNPTTTIRLLSSMKLLPRCFFHPRARCLRSHPPSLTHDLPRIR